MPEPKRRVMDHTVNARRSPLLLVGDAPHFLRAVLGGAAEPAASDANNFYFLLFADAGGAFASHVERLLHLGVSADQILVAAELGAPTPDFLPAMSGRLWVSAQDSQEELRHELASALVAQRHRKLDAELDAHGAPLTPSLRDSAHLAHALALSAELSPRAHSATLRAALIGAAPSAPWNPALSREELLAAAAKLAEAHWAEPARFREAFREAALLLPLRSRTELRTLLERTLSAAGRSYA